MQDLNDHIRRARIDYAHATLDESMVEKNPVLQFEKWFREAMDADVHEPIAMTLATCGKDGKPSARIVLLRNFSADGFCFFTNYASDKGADMAENPNVCLNFYWPELQRQVRIEGVAEKLDRKKSDEYFNSRPHDSRLGAWSSPQSNVIESRKWLEEQVELHRKKFEREELTRPDFWGGFLVRHESVEFWQGRESRLHDRIIYFKEGPSTSSGGWKIVRKAP